MSGDELRVAYHLDLDRVHALVSQMIAVVTDIIPQATEALLNNDLKLAKDLIKGDEYLNNISVELDTACEQILTLQNPMASDLRVIVGAMRINPDVERSGDLVVNIAKATRRMYGTEYHPEIRGIVSKMSEEAQRMFRLAGEAYNQMDEGLATALDDIDDRLDELNLENVRAIFNHHGDGSLELQAAIQLAVVGRYYERIGDHAVNLGEQIRYMVSGWRPNADPGRDGPS